MRSVWCVLVGVLSLACGSDDGVTATVVENCFEEPCRQCLPGDDAIAEFGGCLQDDAVCYQLDDDSWCTGPRAIGVDTCPDGSEPLSDALMCPADAQRCFYYSADVLCFVP